MRKRRRDEEREPGQRRPLERVDAGMRAGVLEQLQKAGGNRAVQEVVAGARLQRDTATTTKPTKPGGRATATGGWVLSLGGKTVGRVRSVEGLTVRAEVITMAGGSGTGVQKQIGRTRLDPAVLEVGLGLDQAFYDWLAAAMASRHGRESLTLHQVDADGQELARVEVQGALVTGVELPQLGAGAPSPASLRVSFQADQARRSAGSGAKVEAKPATDALDPASVQLEVSGIGKVKGLKSVAPWAFKIGVRQTKGGELFPTTGDVGNLVVTLADGAGFDAWASDTLEKGQSSDETERTAVLTVAGKDGRMLELSFAGVGISSADLLSGSGGRRYGLYAESVVLKIL
jgi:phage tail-like protein